MKQKFLPIIVLSLVFALPVFADSTTTKKTETKDIREQAKGEIKDVQEKAKTEIKDIQETLKDKRGEIKKEVAAKRVDQTIKVYTEAADRLDRIVTRIESRIAKIKAAGGDTTAAAAIQTSLDLGKTKLAEARANIAIFAAINVSSATSTSTAQTLFNSVKTAAATAKEALKAAHASLVKTVTLIQGTEKTVKVKEDGERDKDKNASTTNEN